MEELGIVTELKENGFAFVSATGGEGCGSCGCRGACQAFGGGTERKITAINRAGATVGDRVLLTIRSGSVLKASFLVYILPVLGLVIGSVIGQRYSTEIWAGGDPETVSVLTGLFFLVVPFLAIRLFNSRFGARQKYYPVIEKVLDRSHGTPLENPPV